MEFYEWVYYVFIYTYNSLLLKIFTQKNFIEHVYLYPFPSFRRGIAKVGEPNNIAPLPTGIMYLDPAIHMTLRRKQRRLVRDNPGVLAALVKGANLAITECQHQFRNRRWNCSTRNFLRGKNLFGKIVDRGKCSCLWARLDNTLE